MPAASPLHNGGCCFKITIHRPLQHFKTHCRSSICSTPLDEYKNGCTTHYPSGRHVRPSSHMHIPKQKTKTKVFCFAFIRGRQTLPQVIRLQTVATSTISPVHPAVIVRYHNQNPYILQKNPTSAHNCFDRKVKYPFESLKWERRGIVVLKKNALHCTFEDLSASCRTHFRKVESLL